MTVSLDAVGSAPRISAIGFPAGLAVSLENDLLNVADRSGDLEFNFGVRKACHTATINAQQVGVRVPRRPCRDRRCPLVTPSVVANIQPPCESSADEILKHAEHRRFVDISRHKAGGDFQMGEWPRCHHQRAGHRDPSWRCA